MIISLISEPRTGSNNLFKWFYQHPDFTCYWKTEKGEYSAPSIDNFFLGVKFENCEYTTKHLFIKQDFFLYTEATEIINMSDKLIYLYRENQKEQIESWINVKKTNNWFYPWKYRNLDDKKESEYFIKLKEDFKKKFINDKNFVISYEELYYRNGIRKLIVYLDLDEEYIEKWPIGEKYRNNLEIKYLI